MNNMTEFDIINRAMAALTGLDDDARVAAIKTLGEMQHVPAVPHLLNLLETSDPGTRYFIVQALGRIATVETVPVLLDELCGSDPWVRAAAAGSLIQIGAAAVPGLVDGLRHEDKAVRRASAKALGKIGETDQKAVRGLSAALLDIDSGVRRFAAEALGRLGDTTVVPELTEVLTDENADTRIAAFKALASLGTPEAQDAMRQWVRNDRRA